MKYPFMYVTQVFACKNNYIKVTVSSSAQWPIFFVLRRIQERREKRSNVFQITKCYSWLSESEPLCDLRWKIGYGKLVMSLTLSNLYRVLTTSFVFNNMRYISGYEGHASTLWLSRGIYLLGEGYVIPVCVRVIQIFTVTERVSG